MISENWLFPKYFWPYLKKNNWYFYLWTSQKFNDSNDLISIERLFGEILLLDEGFLGGSDGKESACNAGDQALISGWGRSSEEGNGYPFQYSFLENSMDRGDWQATVGVWLLNIQCCYYFLFSLSHSWLFKILNSQCNFF